MNQLAIAISIAAKAFEGKTDKSGKPYILHCLRVMAGVDQKDEELMQIAILHDVPEDTKGNTNEIGITELYALGFSKRVCQAVSLLTHDPVIPYDDYIKALYWNEDARKVKLSDLKDNSDITRLKGLRQKDLERIEKYHRSFIYLSN
jgi:(p)ppGpp synthase/HD superfamily hydrolase